MTFVGVTGVGPLLFDPSQLGTLPCDTLLVFLGEGYVRYRASK